MGTLTNKLKSEHQQIVLLLNEVNKLGISSPGGQSKLLSAKKLLISHLQTEDKELYPKLREAGKADADLNQKVLQYSNEMQSITSFAMEFFTKYENGGSGIDFGKDYGKLYSTLSQRITKEENVLYKEFDKIGL